MDSRGGERPVNPFWRWVLRDQLEFTREKRGLGHCSWHSLKWFLCHTRVTEPHWRPFPTFHARLWQCRHSLWVRNYIPIHGFSLHSSLGPRSKSNSWNTALAKSSQIPETFPRWLSFGWEWSGLSGWGIAEEKGLKRTLTSHRAGRAEQWACSVFIKIRCYQRQPVFFSLQAQAQKRV